MTDRIILSGIEVYAYGGVSAAEKEIGQRYRVTVEMGLDLSRAADTDDVTETVHYGEVHGTVTETLRAQTFNLIESAANRVVDALLAQYPLETVTVKLEKLLPPIDGVVASAAVELTRERRRGAGS